MVEREKVIKGLEHCAEGPLGCQKECPYKRDFGCRSQLAADALSLLKAQEPVEPKLESASDETHWYSCECGTAIDYKDAYCRGCGRPVKWE